MPGGQSKTSLKDFLNIFVPKTLQNFDLSNSLQFVPAKRLPSFGSWVYPDPTSGVWAAQGFTAELL